MARYIDAEKLINESKLDEFGCFDWSEVLAVITDEKLAPTEDVQPVVHAKWFLDGDSSSEEEKCYRCSNCKAVLEEDYKWHNHNYCYHCGAKMDKKEATYIKDIFMTR